MDLYNFNTKADLDQWAIDCLVTYNIATSPETGFNRAAALLRFHANFDREQIILYVGVFELDVNGNPIIGKSLVPYEEVIIANNDNQVDIETMVVTPIESQDPNKIYMGEYDAYVYLTKNNSIMLWDLFKTSIENSIKLKIQ